MVASDFVLENRTGFGHLVCNVLLELVQVVILGYSLEKLVARNAWQLHPYFRCGLSMASVC